MIKGVSKLLLLSLLAMTSCSQQDDIINGGDPSVDEPKEASSVKMTISRASASEFQQAGITEITVYTYRVLRKATELYSESTVEVGDGEFTYEFPLGETFQTVVTANVASVTGKESLETLTLHFDPFGGKEVYATRPVRFASDKSVTTLDLELSRLVARVRFTPVETAAELAAVNEFDALDITFTNVASAYMVSSAAPVLEDITVSTDAAAGFRTTFYTFDTTNGGTNSALGIEYLKNGEQVNSSASMLETGTTYEASGDYSLSVPITSSDFLALPWQDSTASTTSRSSHGTKVEVNVTKL